MINQKELLAELESLMTGFWLTDLANFSAFFWEHLEDINWIGFYLSDGKILRLGPFLGKAACVEIAFDRGVCGAAFSKNEVMLVRDVHEFPSHIACDPVSRSEMVIPLMIGENLVGVLDLDSPTVGRFQESDRELMIAALQILSTRLTTSPVSSLLKINR